RVLAPAGDGGGDDARPGRRGGEARPDRGADRRRSAGGGGAEPRPDRRRGGGARRGTEPHGSRVPTRAHTAQHDRQLRGERSARRARGRENRRGHLHHAPGSPAGGRGGLTRVLALFGPTASGKSAVAEEIARRISAEHVSADAMQAYR